MVIVAANKYSFSYYTTTTTTTASTAAATNHISEVAITTNFS
jgi:hypothetical protein